MTGAPTSPSNGTAPTRTGATGRCGTTALICRRCSSASLRRSTAPWQRSTTSTSDEASGRHRRSAPRSRMPYPARSSTRRRSAICERCKQARSSPRDRALALVPFYAGARIAETVALDVDDVRLSARKGILRIYGKAERVREVPIHPELRKALTDWLEERRDWPAAKHGPALFLNQRGHRLGAKGAHDVITGIADRGGARRPRDRSRAQALVRDHARARR